PAARARRAPWAGARAGAIDGTSPAVRAARCGPEDGRFLETLDHRRARCPGMAEGIGLDERRDPGTGLAVARRIPVGKRIAGEAARTVKLGAGDAPPAVECRVAPRPEAARS